jgi:hypothetical protein
MPNKDGPNISIRDFYCTDPIPDEGMQNVERLLESGELFRYIAEHSGGSEVALFENDFAQAITNTPSVVS